MLKSYHIPKPCHEDWDKMTPSEKGRFCSSCSKEVVDFTAMNKVDIIDFLERKNKVCGRFKKGQISTTSNLSFSNWSVKWGLTIGLSSVLFLSFPIHAQGISTRIQGGEIVDMGTNIIQDTVHIKGVVLDDIGDPIPFVNVILKDNQNLLRGTTTDLDGEFNLIIHKSTLTEMCELEFSYIGYSNVSIPFKGNNFIIKLDPSKEPSKNIILGEVARPHVESTKGATYTREGNDFIKKIY